MKRLLILLLLVSLATGAAQTLAENDYRLALTLRKLPHVSRIIPCVTSAEATTRIIHVKDRHLVNYEDLSAVLNTTWSFPPNEATLRKLYDKHLEDVAAVQREQLALLSALLNRLEVAAVFLEGFTDEDMPSYSEMNQDISSREKEARADRDEFLHWKRLRFGAAGHMFRAGNLKQVCPLEDAALLKAANPYKDDGTFKRDDEANENREDAMVRNLLKKKGTVVAILGGGHDLTDNLRRLADGKVEYIQVEVKAYAKVHAE